MVLLIIQSDVDNVKAPSLYYIYMYGVKCSSHLHAHVTKKTRSFGRTKAI